jgi:uncharacterized circularly permuted ATP-grasp superfamily protein
MSEPQHVTDAVGALLADYRPDPGVFDELLDADGRPRPHWQPMLRGFATMGPEQRRNARSTAANLLKEHDVAHIAADGGGRRPWHLDV